MSLLKLEGEFFPELEIFFGFNRLALFISPRGINQIHHLQPYDELQSNENRKLFPFGFPNETKTKRFFETRKNDVSKRVHGKKNPRATITMKKKIWTRSVENNDAKTSIFGRIDVSRIKLIFIKIEYASTGTLIWLEAKISFLSSPIPSCAKSSQETLIIFVCNNTMKID